MPATIEVDPSEVHSIEVDPSQVSDVTAPKPSAPSSLGTRILANTVQTVDQFKHAGQGVVDVLHGLWDMGTKPPREIQEAADKGEWGKVAGLVLESSVPGYTMLIKPHLEEARAAKEYWQAGRPSEAFGHGVAAATPFFGPVLAGLTETGAGEPPMPPKQQVGPVRAPDLPRAAGQAATMYALGNPDVPVEIARGAADLARTGAPMVRGGAKGAWEAVKSPRSVGEAGITAIEHYAKPLTGLPPIVGPTLAMLRTAGGAVRGALAETPGAIRTRTAAAAAETAAAETAAAAAAEAATLDPYAKSLTGQKFADLPPERQTLIRDLAARANAPAQGTPSAAAAPATGPEAPLPDVGPPKTLTQMLDEELAAKRAAAVAARSQSGLRQAPAWQGLPEPKEGAPPPAAPAPTPEQLAQARAATLAARQAAAPPSNLATIAATPAAPPPPVATAPLDELVAAAHRVMPPKAAPAASEPAPAPPAAPPTNLETLAATPQEAPPPVVAPALLESLAQRFTGKKFDDLLPHEQATVRGIASHMPAPAAPPPAPGGLAALAGEPPAPAATEYPSSWNGWADLSPHNDLGLQRKAPNIPHGQLYIFEHPDGTTIEFQRRGPGGRESVGQWTPDEVRQWREADAAPQTEPGQRKARLIEIQNQVAERILGKADTAPPPEIEPGITGRSLEQQKLDRGAEIRLAYRMKSVKPAAESIRSANTPEEIQGMSRATLESQLRQAGYKQKTVSEETYQALEDELGIKRPVEGPIPGPPTAPLFTTVDDFVARAQQSGLTEGIARTLKPDVWESLGVGPDNVAKVIKALGKAEKR